MSIRVGAASIGLVLLLGACSGGRDAGPSLPTLPIPTEAPLPPRTYPPLTTTVVVSTTSAASAPAVPVLVHFVPKSPAEQEVVDALKVLLPIEYLVRSVRTEDPTAIAGVYEPEFAEIMLARVKQAKAMGHFSTAGTIDRFVMTSVKRVSPTVAIGWVCFADNGRLYSLERTTTSLLDDAVVTRIIEYRLLRLLEGWRIDQFIDKSKTIGADECAH